MTYKEMLASHAELQKRRVDSEAQLEEIRGRFESANFFRDKKISVFTAGSIGRRDAGKNSDLDIFVLSEQSDDKRSRLFDLEVLAKLIEINRAMEYPAFSNDGQFLKVYSIQEMKSKSGDPRDDSENLFTARLLFLLESVHLCNHELYNTQLAGIVEHYFRDYPAQKSFRPLFLLNDILRYWRTLCLNYERIRHDPARPWRKKNINLKFSRMLTVFSTVLPMIALPVKQPDDFLELAKISPLDRLALGLDALKDSSMTQEFESFLDDYEGFLKWKEEDNIENKMSVGEVKTQAQQAAARFSNFLYAALTHDSIPRDLRKFLII